MTSFYDEVEKYLNLTRVNYPVMFSEMFDGWLAPFRKEETDPFKGVGIEYKIVEHHGGEGEGDNYYSVWKFNKGDLECFVQLQGWYTSHEGAEFESMFEVTPVQKTITVYESV